MVYLIQEIKQTHKGLGIMGEVKNLLIVKIAETHGKLPKSLEGLKERSKGEWKRNIDTVGDLEYMIVLHQQKVKAVYKIMGATQVENNRVVFDLDANTPQTFRGSMVDYPTSNVCSDLSIDEFLEKIK